MNNFIKYNFEKRLLSQNRFFTARILLFWVRRCGEAFEFICPTTPTYPKQSKKDCFYHPELCLQSVIRQRKRNKQLHWRRNMCPQMFYIFMYFFVLHWSIESYHWLVLAYPSTHFPQHTIPLRTTIMHHNEVVCAVLWHLDVEVAERDVNSVPFGHGDQPTGV